MHAEPRDAEAGSRHPLSLAAGNVQEFPPDAMVVAAAEAGFDHTGIWVDPRLWTPATTRAVRARLDETGLSVLDVEVVWIQPGGIDDDLRRILDIGAEIGARHALVVSSDPDATATRRGFAALCRHAEGTGLSLVLEFLPITAVRTLTDALEIVTDVGHPLGRLLIDTLHLARTGGTVDDVAGLDPALFPYLQIADAPLAGPGTDHASLLSEAVDGRLLPGDGALPIAELLRHFPDRLPLSPEIRSRALRERYPEIRARAAAIARATRRFLADRR